MRVDPRIVTLTCLDRPLAVEAFSFLAFWELGRCHKKKTPGSQRMPRVRGSLLQLGF